MKVSPIAEYLRINKAIPKRDKRGCDFISPEGLYLGRLTKSIVNNYTVFSIKTFGENFKPMYTKSIAYGQQFAYIKNDKSKLGVSLVPIKTFMRSVFENFIDRTCSIVDTERTLKNRLDLIAVNEHTHASLFDINGPFSYRDEIKENKTKEIKKLKFKYVKN